MTKVIWNLNKLIFIQVWFREFTTLENTSTTLETEVFSYAKSNQNQIKYIFRQSKLERVQWGLIRESFSDRK